MSRFVLSTVYVLCMLVQNPIDVDLLGYFHIGIFYYIVILGTEEYQRDLML